MLRRQRAKVEVVHHEAHRLHEAEGLGLERPVLLGRLGGGRGRVDGALLRLGEPEVDADREAVRPAEAGDEGLRRAGAPAGNHHVGRIDALEERRDLLTSGFQSTRLIVEREHGNEPELMPRGPRV